MDPQHSEMSFCFEPLGGSGDRRKTSEFSRHKAQGYVELYKTVHGNGLMHQESRG